MGGHQLLYVLTQSVPQVPTVGDLHRVRRRGTGAINVAAGPVSADHFHARAGAKPASEVFALVAVEDVYWSVPVGQVNQHGAIVASAAKREFINAKHLHPAGRWVWQRADQPQQG